MSPPSLYCMIEKMAKRVMGIIMMLLGLALILTPWYLFPVCGRGRYAPKDPGIYPRHKCANTLKAETVLGLLTISVGAISLVRPRRKILIGSSAALLILSGLVALFPLQITGLCKMATMPCRMGTLPALITLSILMAIIGVAGIIQGRGWK